jgi:hypothetical protein
VWHLLQCCVLFRYPRGSNCVAELRLQRGEDNDMFIRKTEISIGARATGMHQLALLCLHFCMQLDMKQMVISAQIDVNTHPAITMG